MAHQNHINWVKGMRIFRCVSLYFLVILCCTLPMVAGGAAGRVDADSLIVSGNSYYEAGQFDSALMSYRLVEMQGLESAGLYYNMGNSYFRLREYARAILYYERALKLDPGYGDARFNLDLARTYTVDRFESVESWGIGQWVSGWHELFPARTWSVLTYLFFALLVVSVVSLLFARRRSLWTVSLTGSIVGLVLFVLTLVLGVRSQRLQLESNRGVIQQSVVSVKGAPASESKVLFLLHSGSTVQIVGRSGDWLEIRIVDGHQGWVESSVLEEI